MSRRIFRAALLTVLALCAVIASAEAGAKSAVGTWKLDTAKSSFGNMPTPKFEQLVVTTDDPDALKWSLTGSTSDGKTYSSSFDGPIDGTYHSIVSSEGENSVAYTRTPSRGVKWSIKDKSGNVFETGSSHLSADGNTLTFRGTAQTSKSKTDFVSVFTKTQ